MIANNNPLFGRRWNLAIAGPVNAETQTQQVWSVSSDQFTDALRVRFDVRTVWYQWYWTADIEIWNPDEKLATWLLSQGNVAASPNPAQPSTSVMPIQQGMGITLQAGYQSPGPYGIVERPIPTIWSGYVLQPMFDRVNQTDFVVTLHCIIGLNEDTRNSLNKVYGAGITQQQIVQQMAKDAYSPISTGTIADGLSSKSLSYPKVVFGTPRKALTEIARDNNMQWWLDQHGLLNVGDLSKNFPSTAKFTFTPQTGIIGTPQQTQFGVNCRLLLNPNVVVSNPPMAIKIDNTVIQQLQRNVGDLPSAVSILSQSGTYVVVGARYIGDTRGTPWYTDVTGWLTALDKVAAIAAATGVQFDRP